MIVILSTVFYRGIENEKTVGEVVEALYFATILQVLISGYSENGESNNAVFLNLCSINRGSVCSLWFGLFQHNRIFD